MVAPYLTLMREAAPQRDYPLREVFNSVRWIVRTASPWRLMPHDLPPWTVAYQQTQRWINIDVFEAMVHGWFGWRKDGLSNRLLRFSTDALCNPRPEAVDGPAMMGTNEKKGARYISPLTRWDTCWLSLLRPPMHKSAPQTQIAAFSVSIVGGEEMLDLCYQEDSRAEVDFNVVITGEGKIIQVQATVEGEPFSREQLDHLMNLARGGINELMKFQRTTLNQSKQPRWRLSL